jgi:tetratricopeptide (TPR) repeat protein
MLALGAWGWNWWQISRTAPVRQRMDAAQQFVQAGNGAAAAQKWQEAVKLDPDNVEAWQLLSDYHLKAENWKAAMSALQQLERLQPETRDLYGNLALCATRLGDLNATERYAEAEVQRSPDNAAALQVLIQALTTRGEVEKRTKYARRLLKLQPENPDALAQLTDALTTQGKYSEALPLLNKLVTLAPGYPPAYAMRGEALFNTDPSPKGLAKAQTDLLQALQLNPNDNQSRLFLARVFIRKREAARAIPHLEAIERSPDPGVIYMVELANAYQQLGQMEKAVAARRRFAAMEKVGHEISTLKSRVSNNPNDFNYNLQLGLRLLESSNPLGVEKYLGKARQLRPQDPRVKSALQRLESSYVKQLQSGLRALEKRQYTEVAKHIRQVMLLRPYDPRTKDAVTRVVQDAGGSVGLDQSGNASAAPNAPVTPPTSAVPPTSSQR